MIETDVQVGETVYTLRPTLEAMRKVNRQCGSLYEAYERIQRQDGELIIAVLAAGADIQANQMKSFSNEVFEAGVMNLAIGAGKYVLQLMNPGEAVTGEPGQGNP